MRILFFLSLFPLAAALPSISGNELTNLNADELRQLCPNEYKFCAGKVAEGKCFGNSRRAQELKRKCPCSCNNVHHRRIQNCCKVVGKREMEFCLPLCAYNNTLSQVRQSLNNLYHTHYLYSC